MKAKKKVLTKKRSVAKKRSVVLVKPSRKQANIAASIEHGDPYIALSMRAFPTAGVYLSRASAALSEIVESRKPPTLAGLCARLGVSKNTYMRYASGEYGDEYVEPMEFVRTVIEADKNEGLLTGVYQTAGAALDLKNQHGWQDRFEQTVNLNGRMRISADEMTPEAWEEKYGSGRTFENDAP